MLLTATYVFIFIKFHGIEFQKNTNNQFNGEIECNDHGLLQKLRGL